MGYGLRSTTHKAQDLCKASVHPPDRDLHWPSDENHQEQVFRERLAGELATTNLINPGIDDGHHYLLLVDDDDDANYVFMY